MGILLYSEYIVKQALWLQIKDEERTNFGTNSTQFYIEKYIQYLIKCNVNNNLPRYIHSYLLKLNSYGNFGKGKIEDFSKEVQNNIVEIIDYMVLNYNDKY